MQGMKYLNMPSIIMIIKLLTNEHDLLYLTETTK